MNILMFGWEFPPYISGGLGTACAGLTKGLNAVGGVKTTFVLPKSNANPALDSTEFVDSIRFVQVDSTVPAAQSARVVPRKTPASSYGGATMTGAAMRYASSAARMLSDSDEFDVIHAHDWLTYTAGVHAKRMTGKPLVVHVHSTEYDRSGTTYDPDIYKIERLGMDMADKIIAVSNYTRDVIVERYGQHPDKIVTIYNATEKWDVIPRQRSAIEQRPVVTFLGRITYQKGPEYFVEAARLVLQKVAQVEFVMAGDGDLLPRMKSLVSALGMAEHFRFPGFIGAAEVRALFAQSDVYVMPSVSEPFGIAALEAINADVPVVLSSNCGAAELLDSVLTVAPDDCQAMADAIVRLITDPQYARALAAGAREEMRNVSWDESAGNLKGLYQDLVAQAC